MLFNSPEFIAIFLPVVLVGFYLLRFIDIRFAIAFLLFASLAFYAWEELWWILILIGSMTVNLAFGRALMAKRSRVVLAVGISLNLLLLSYFKYLNFAVETINQVTSLDLHMARIILPIGISFFTFQQIAFLADAYQKKVKDFSFLHYGLFVAFFPQLIAGPIVHHSVIIGQLRLPDACKLKFGNIYIGLSIFVIGLLKKLVLADSMEMFASPVFDAAHDGDTITFLEAWGGALSYSFQIYFDFSGYSDMAIGLGRMFGNQVDKSLVRFSSNAQGYRDEAWPENKAPDEAVITVVGDSVVAAIETHAHDRFTERLEEKLIADGIKARVINAGVGGQNLINHLNAVTHMKRELSPDYVVLMITDADDYSLDYQSTIFDDALLEYDFTNDQVVKRLTPLTDGQKLYRQVLSYARLSWVVRQTAKGINSLRNSLMNRIKDKLWEKSSTDSKPVLLPCPRHTSLPEKNYRLSERILLDISETVGPKLILVRSPMIQEVKDLSVEKGCDLGRAEAWFKDFLQRSNIDYVKIVDELKKSSMDDLYLDQTHYGEAGQEIIASALHKKLKPMLSAFRE